MKKALFLIPIIMIVFAVDVCVYLFVKLSDQVTALAGTVAALEVSVDQRFANTAGGAGGVEIIVTDINLPIADEDFIGYSSPYGIRRSPFSDSLARHTGVDLYGVWHARIVAVGPGTILEHWVPPGQRAGFRGHEVLGGMLIIELDDGAVVTYGHLSETYVNEGDRVTAGQVIGRQGSTGISTGEHLHFEVSIDNEIVNPLKYLIEIFNDQEPSV